MAPPDQLDLESTKQHSHSPGLVSDREIVCRGGYDPMHYKNGRPRPSVIRAAELLKGSLSVWRGGQGGEPEYLAAVEKIKNGPPDQVLKEVFAPFASSIRGIEITGFERIFFVIDDCQTHDDGSYDPLHAGVKLSPGLQVQTTEDELFLLAKAQLWRVLTAFARPAPVL